MTDITLEAQKMAVTRAIEAHSNAKALLFAHDGKTPINAPAVHDRELARLLTPVETAVERAIETADSVIAEVEALRLAPHADPTMALSAADLDDANRRAQWIAEDCAALPLPDLVERLRAVQASGNKSSVWLHTRYAKARWQAESGKVPQAPDLPPILGATARARCDRPACWPGARASQARRRCRQPETVGGRTARLRENWQEGNRAAYGAVRQQTARPALASHPCAGAGLGCKDVTTWTKR